MLWVRLNITCLFLVLCLSCDEKSEEESPLSGTSMSELPEGFGQLAIGGINELPQVTDPVNLTDESTSVAELNDFDGGVGQLEIGVFGLYAGSGISYGSSTTIDDFSNTTNPSYGACEMVNRGRGFLFEAATSDEISCILGFVLGNSTAFYDNSFHIIDLLQYSNGQNVVERIRFKIEGTKDNVTGLTFYQCRKGVQEVYAQKSIASGKGNISVKRKGNPENPEVDSYKALITVAGDVDSKGGFVGLKKMLNRTSNTFASGAISENTYKIVQGEAHILFSGYGEQTDRQSADSYISYHQLMDNNTDGQPYDLSLLGVGNGGILYRNDGSVSSQGWDGSSFQVNTQATELGRLSGLTQSLPSSQDQTSMDFSGDEVYDCAGDAEYSLDEETLRKLVEASGGNYNLIDDGQGYSEGSIVKSCSGYTLPQNTHLQCSDFLP